LYREGQHNCQYRAVVAAQDRSLIVDNRSHKASEALSNFRRLAGDWERPRRLV